ncbi:ester cyclase [Paenibacillus sp. FJAT-27812]|uniref:ester cyclase n=1 Tax=Paenibacillus sp. FJAT-27812 TaxID=1684143 RepID=UPI0009E6FBEC|nr:ester cyclase [Paenibacillus sp. FJAT-27812]
MFYFRAKLGSGFCLFSYQSKEGLKQCASRISASFPDKHYTVEEMIAQGEKVISRMIVKGTHKGIFFGTAPTGNSTEHAGSSVFFTRCSPIYCLAQGKF